jgi:hypothetical protein
MSNEKQTAVEWYAIEMAEYLRSIYGDGILNLDILKQAKEMEKEQIEEAYKYARAHWSREDGNAEQYYEQTYGGNK